MKKPMFDEVWDEYIEIATKKKSDPDFIIKFMFLVELRKIGESLHYLSLKQRFEEDCC